MNTDQGGSGDGSFEEIRILGLDAPDDDVEPGLSLIHISEPTRLLSISYAVFCLKKKKKEKKEKEEKEFYSHHSQ